MPTAPRPGAARQAEAEDLSFSFKWDGELYTVRPNDVSGKITGQLRRLTGFSMMGLMAAAGQDFDSDVVAALIYIARRQRGENPSYDQIADGITIADLKVKYEDVAEEPAEDPDSPEA